MEQFLSFAADSVATQLAVGSKGLTVLPETKIPDLIEGYKKTPREGYASMFSFLGPEPKTFKEWKGVHKLTLDLFVLDFDSKENVQAALEDAGRFILKYRLKTHQYSLFQSGSKGYHLYMGTSLYGGLLAPATDLHIKCRKFAESLQSEFPTLDVGVFALPQKFRIPFSVHPKTSKQKLPIEGTWPLGWVSSQDKNEALIQAFISAQMQEPSPLVLGSAEEEDSAFMQQFRALKAKPCITAMLTQNFKSGERHHAFLLMVSDLFHAGQSVPAIRSTLRPWMLQNNPEERAKELETHLRDLQNGSKILFGCKDKTRERFCSAKCEMFPKLSGETLASRPVPKDIDEKALEKAQNKSALVIIKKFAAKLIEKAPIVHVSESNAMYHFDGEKYTEVKPIFFKALMEQAMPSMCDKKKSEELVATIQRRTTTPHKRLQQATDKYINFKNGHFNKETGELEPRLSARFFTYCLPFDYDPTALAPRFEQFLAEVTSGPERPQGDKDLGTILLEFMGYTFSGDEQWAQQALFMLGEGHNGKSKLIDLVTYMVGGDENFSSMPLEMLAKPERLPALENKLGNMVSEENPDSFRHYGSAFKALCTGDSLTARRLHGEPYQIKSRAKMWVSTNNAPQTNDTSHGFMKRMLFIPFDARMLRPEEMPGFLALGSGSLPAGLFPADLSISKKLEAEAAGVFNLAWAAYKLAKERGGFTQATVSREMRAEFAEEASSTQFVIKACFELAPNERVDYVAAKEAFTARAKGLGSWASPSMGTLRKDIQRTWPNLIKTVKCNGKNWLVGLRVINPGLDPAGNPVLGSGPSY